MCGRYASARKDLALVADLRVTSVIGPPPPPSWNVAPTQPARVVLDRVVPDTRSGRLDRQLRTMRWGLVPSWAEDARIGSRLINARADSVTLKPAFAPAAARRRCLVPADGYYEWERRAGAARSVPHFLHDEAGLLAFAGLYEIWRDPHAPPEDPQPWIWSYAILTTKAPDALGHIHDRAPVVLTGGLRDEWLDPALTDLDHVRDLLRCMPEVVLQARPVSHAVNDHRNNGPQLVARAG